ncbi:MAG: phytanoyl-CoA dioxygenase family protein [Verrucomicrobiae bacterium]|nr:phytanoyl-CoA dioxygenase family protein [Verrucomicrobiae bacterium]
MNSTLEHPLTLAHSDLELFRTEGYLVMPQFFEPREIAAMLRELERFKSEGLIRNVSTAGDGKTHSNERVNLQICPITPRSELYRALPFHPKILSVVSQLIGEPFEHHLDQIFLKPARNGAGTSWHQDNSYFFISDPTKGVGMWVALHDSHVLNGTMHVIPRAFDVALEHKRDPLSDHHIRCFPDESKAIPVEMKAGGVLFFNYGVPHCTKSNQTDSDRAGLALHFLRTDFRHKEIAAAGAYPGPYLRGPLASGGQNEHGKLIEGTWSEEVDRIVG